MGITIAELVETPYLRTRLHAGAAGCGNAVSWAHSCEVPNPWNWLESGDLLMTNGYSLPAAPDEQVAFVEQLHSAGISGLAIGEHQQAPRLTAAMSVRADALALPILFTAFEVPFVALARTVADANSRQEQLRLQQTVRLYERVREATVDQTQGQLMGRLSDDLYGQLHVLDRARGIELLPARRAASSHLKELVVHALSEAAWPLPALLRVPLAGEGTTALVVPVPSRREAVLVAVPRSARKLDLAILQHVATIAALQVERDTAEREERRRVGAETLALLIDGQLDSATARHQLSTQGLGDGPLVVAACDAGEGSGVGALHHRLADDAVPHLLLSRGEVLLVLMTDDAVALERLRAALGDDVRVGLCDAFAEPARAADAARQARWALQAAASQRSPLVRYGNSAPLFMPRTISELENAVGAVLGILIDYDRSHGTDLVESLRTFLQHNRSWQRAAGEMFIHKQTLVYRMKRVEELTGRKLDDTASVAELWLALRAMELGGADVAAPSSASEPSTV